MRERRLMAVMFTDIKGFSTLMGKDETGTLRLLEQHNAAMDPCVPAHDGRLVKRIGDSYMVWFPSALDGLRCAVAMQKALARLNERRKRKIQVRIGINAGDVVIGQDNDLYGNVVNMAKRLESEARPGGICVSESIRQNISSPERSAFAFEDAGLLPLKGSPEPVQSWHVCHRRQSRGMSSEERKLMRNYCRRLIAANEYLDFRGILQVREILRLRIEDLYVPLWATTQETHRLVPPKEPVATLDEEPSYRDLRNSFTYVARVEDALIQGLSQGGHAPERRVEVAQALRKYHRMVVLGDPGTGKSTFVKLLALTFARGRGCVRKKFQIDEDRLPLLAPIAAYGEAVTQKPQLEFAEFLFQRLTADGLADPSIVQHALEQGEGLLLLDGLDEVLDLNTRIHVSRQIERFITACAAGNRVVVTSRVAGYQRVGFAGEFAHLTLLPFGDQEIKAFVRNWARAYQSCPKPTAGWERRAEQRTQEITESISSTPAIQRLAANPLLVTILALIHQQGTRLPNQRVELYRLCVEALAEHWQRARSLYRPIDLYLGTRRLDERYVVGFLAPIAFWLLETRPTGLLHRTELEQKIAERLIAQEGVNQTGAPTVARQFVELIREQSGLLIERGSDLFDFAHPTFKEYLAARYLAERRDPLKLLGERIFAPRWKEVVLLTAGILKGDYLDDFLSGILESGTKYDDLLHRPLLLVARCLADEVPSSAPLRQRILEELFTLWEKTHRNALRRAIGYLFTETKGSSLAEEIADRFLPLLGDKDNLVRRRAAEALGQLGARSERVLAELLALAHNKKVEDWVRKPSIEALGRLGERSERVLSVLLAVVRNEKVDIEERGAAVRALGQLGGRSERVLSVLLAVVQEKTEEGGVRYAAVEALGHLGERSERVLSELLSLAQDKKVEDGVRQAAAEALGRLGERGKAAELSLALAQDKKVRFGVRQAAAEALKGLAWSDKRALDALARIVRARDDISDVLETAWGVLLELANAAADERSPAKSSVSRRR